MRELFSAPVFCKRAGIILVCCGTVMFLAGLGGFSSAPTAKAPPVSAAVSLSQAPAEIPKTLKIIYASLDRGDPAAAAAFLSPRILQNSRVLDFICRPFTYRAHYIEAVI